MLPVRMPKWRRMNREIEGATVSAFVYLRRQWHNDGTEGGGQRHGELVAWRDGSWGVRMGRGVRMAMVEVGVRWHFSTANNRRDGGRGIWP